MTRGGKTLKNLIVVMLVLVIVTSAVFAQPDPPRGLSVSEEYYVHLTWLPPKVQGDLFYTDFSNFNPDEWEIYDPDNWSVEDGWIRYTVNSFGTIQPIVFTGHVFDSYILEVDFRYFGSNTPGDINLFVVGIGNDPDTDFRAIQTQVLMSEPTKVRFTFGDFWPLGVTSYLDDRILANPGAVNHVTIQVDTTDNTSCGKVYLNNRYVFDIHSNYADHTGGQISLAGKWETGGTTLMEFDNLSVMSSEGPPEINYYSVYRNGQLIGTTTDCWFSDVESGPNLHTYTVTAHSAEGESLQSEPVTATSSGAIQVLETFEEDIWPPDGWITMASPATQTWTHRLYPGDAYAQFAHYIAPTQYSYLITSPFMLDQFTSASLELEAFYYGYADVSVDIQPAPGSPWVSLLSSVSDTWADYTLDLTPYVNNDELRLRFSIEDAYGMGLCGIDDVIIRGFENSYGMSLTPLNTTVPQAGGSVLYDANVHSELGIPFPNVNYWTTVIGPGGATYGPLAYFTFNAAPEFDVTVTDLALTVPPFAPAGKYIFFGKIGIYPDEVYIADTFTFNKSEDLTAGRGQIQDVIDEVSEHTTSWSTDLTALRDALQGLTTVQEENTAADIKLPNEFALAPVFPNPFNAQATVTIALREAGELRVVVYDLLGRQVMVLNDDSRSAGTHTFTLNAGDLASGLYFVRAKSGVGDVQTQKVIVMK